MFKVVILKIKIKNIEKYRKNAVQKLKDSI